MSDEYLEQFKESMYALQDAGYGLELVEQDIFNYLLRILAVHQ